MKLVAAIAVAFTFTACSQSNVPVKTPSPVAAEPFNVGVAVPGAPDVHNAQFLADQQSLYDATQFGDVQFYQAGYHWKIDTAIGPHAIVNAVASLDSATNTWSIDIRFTPAAGARWAAITTAAFNAGQGTPLNRIAIFVGRRVVSAPAVQNPSSVDTRITGDFTEQEAVTLANEISAAATG